MENPFSKKKIKRSLKAKKKNNSTNKNKRIIFQPINNRFMGHVYKCGLRHFFPIYCQQKSLKKKLKVSKGKFRISLEHLIMIVQSLGKLIYST